MPLHPANVYGALWDTGQRIMQNQGSSFRGTDNSIINPTLAGDAGLLPKFAGQLANAVDRDGDRVGGLLHDADTDRCPATNQIAGQQCHVVGDLADELLRAEDHIGNRVVLTFRTIENAAYADRSPSGGRARDPAASRSCARRPCARPRCGVRDLSQARWLIIPAPMVRRPSTSQADALVLRLRTIVRRGRPDWRLLPRRTR